MKNLQKGFAVTIIIAIVALLVIAIAGGIYFVSKGHQKSKENTGLENVAPGNDKDQKNVTNTDVSIKTNTAGDVCSQFPKESIASITGLDIVSAEIYQTNVSDSTGCRYFIRGKAYAPVLTISKYNTDVTTEKQKYGNHPLFKDWRVGTNSEIPMEHFITYNEVQQLSEIYLLPESNMYYKISLYSLNALKSSQIVNLAAKLAVQIK